MGGSKDEGKNRSLTVVFINYLRVCNKIGAINRVDRQNGPWRRLRLASRSHLFEPLHSLYDEEGAAREVAVSTPQEFTVQLLTGEKGPDQRYAGRHGLPSLQKFLERPERPSIESLTRD